VKERKKLKRVREDLLEEINTAKTRKKQREGKAEKKKGAARKNEKKNGSLKSGKLPNDLSKASEVSVCTEHVTTETGGVVLAQIG
jgi:hypothetical protein